MENTIETLPLRFLGNEVVSLFFHTFNSSFKEEIDAGMTIGDIKSANDFMHNDKNYYRLRKVLKKLPVMEQCYAFSLSLKTIQLNDEDHGLSAMRDFLQKYVQFGMCTSTVFSNTLKKTGFHDQYEGFGRLYLYNPVDTTNYNLDVLSANYAIPCETLRVAYLKHLDWIRNILLGKNEFFRVPNSLSLFFCNIWEKYGNSRVSTVQQLHEDFSGYDAKTMAFILKILDYEKFQRYQNPLQYYLEPMYIKSQYLESVAFNSLLGPLKSILSEEPFGVSWSFNLRPRLEQIIDQLKQFQNNKKDHVKWEEEEREIEIRKENITDTLLEMIKVSSQFEIVQNSIYENDLSVRLCWKHLSQSQRLYRILYDHAVQFPGNPAMSRNDLALVYNDLAGRMSVDKIKADTPALRQTENIVPIGKTGDWKYIETGVPKMKNVQDFIKEFILKQNGITTYKDTLQVVRKMGYPHTDRTIRTYLSNVAAPVIGKDLYVYKGDVKRFEQEKGYRFR